MLHRRSSQQLLIRIAKISTHLHNTSSLRLQQSRKAYGTAPKIIKDDDQTPVRGIKRGAIDLEEDVLLSGKRMAQPSMALVSPYHERKTVYGQSFVESEKKIVDYIWTDKCSEGKIIFNGFGLQIECIWFLSLYPGIELSINIIDLWSTLLNDEERYRGKQSVTKNVYCTSIMMPHHLLGVNQASIKKRRLIFKENIESILRSQKKKNFNDVNLVFFPCIKISEGSKGSNHYYIICIDLNSAEIDIIDNVHNDDDNLDLRYGPYALCLIVTFINFLESQNHSKVEALYLAKPKILKMPWRTRQNGVDCGLFVMRHMEMYIGNGVWVHNFKNEEQGQKAQINFFRAKYLAKILHLNCNLCKKDLVDKANEEWRKQGRKSLIITNQDVKGNSFLMKKFKATLDKASC